MKTLTPNTPTMAEALKALPFVWFNKDTEEYECKTDEAAKWFVTHHNEILTALQAQGRTQSAVEVTTVFDGWFIPFDCMSDTARSTFRRMVDVIKRGGQVNVIARCDGKDHHWECDGLKYAKPAPDPYRHSLSLSAAPPVTAPIEKVDGLAEAIHLVQDERQNYNREIGDAFDLVLKAARLQLQRQED